MPLSSLRIALHFARGRQPYLLLPVIPPK